MKSYIAIFLLIFCGACQKKDNTPPDAAKVVISVTSPAPAQTFHSNDTVYINAGISYVSELHGYEVTVVDTATGFTVFDDAQHGHADHFVINEKWTTPVTVTKIYRLTVSATVDHSGTVAKKEQFFQVIP